MPTGDAPATRGSDGWCRGAVPLRPGTPRQKANAESRCDAATSPCSTTADVGESASCVQRDEPTAPAWPDAAARSAVTKRTRSASCATRAEARQRGTRPAPPWSLLPHHSRHQRRRVRQCATSRPRPRRRARRRGRRRRRGRGRRAVRRGRRRGGAGRGRRRRARSGGGGVAR